MDWYGIVKVGLEILRQFVADRKRVGDEIIPIVITVPVSRISPSEAMAIKDFLKPLTTEEIQIQHQDETYWFRFEPW